MIQEVNSKYGPLITTDNRYVILMGGRAAGRSTVASQFATSKLIDPGYFRCAIMRYVLGDIRNSIYQDILDRAEEQEIKDHLTIRENILSISYGANKINGIGFKKSSGDQKAKLKSLANYNCVIVEEADEVAEEDFMQLDDSLRTVKSPIKIILLLNPPPRGHWIIKRWFNLQESGIEGFYKPVLKSDIKDTTFIHTSYLDNAKNITESSKQNYEAYKERNPDHYYNMIRGLVSEGVRGRIFKNWQTISDEEFEALPYRTIYGLDFGFANDPTACVAVKEHNDKVYLRELLYETGLTNPQVAKRLKEVGVTGDDLIYADSAEPKSIKEVSNENLNIQPAVKGPDSIRAGIDMLLEKEVYYTESSDNLATEQQEYKWALDRNKEPTNVPVDAWNDLMDATRYSVFTNATQGEPDIFFM